MKTNTISKTATHIIDDYRFTFHLLFNGETGLIEIEKLTYKKKFLGHIAYWQRIYFGHDTPIREALKFFDENIIKDK